MWNQKFQCKSIYALSNRMIVFDKYLLQYCYFQWIFKFLLEYFKLYPYFQSYQSKYVTFLNSHTKLSNEFILIHTHQDLLYMLHPFFRWAISWINIIKFRFILIIFLFQNWLKNEATLTILTCSYYSLTCSYYSFSWKSIS